MQVPDMIAVLIWHSKARNSFSAHSRWRELDVNGLALKAEHQLRKIKALGLLVAVGIEDHSGSSAAFQNMFLSRLASE